MRLSDATVVIRPRTTWEAMDLGVLLSQRHRRLLMTSWAIVTLPAFALLSWVLWDSPSLAVFIFWWLKPAFDRLPLYILSKAMFGETPTLKQALCQFPRLLQPQLLASLTWRRLSLSRSFLMPVVQLEGLSGQPRQQRLQVLLQRNAGAARWLTIIGVHLESALWIGLMVLFYLFLPQQVELDWSWQTLITAATQDWRWLEHLTNAFYALVLIAWEPVYVACGFSLYLNRRTVLEAWDIELVFRRMRQRVSSAAVTLLLAAFLLMPTTQTVWAAEPVISPDSPRLLDQPLTSQASRDSIKAILDQPPFKNKESVTRYRFGEDQPATDTADDDQSTEWLEALLKLLDNQRFGAAATLIEAVLWSVVIGAIGLLIWHYRDGLQAFVSRRPALNSKVARPLPQQAFGLDLNRETLPADIAASAERLWQTHPREALGLLYRGLLSHLLHDFNMALKPADTEGQVLERIEHLQQPALLAFSKNLTGHWQNMAYGHRLPPAPVQQELCDGWRALFGPGALR
ncbi:membrane protein [Pseudomonas fluorescens]|uniref:Membrane protein n=1 Tax=Pseudomonas fluorescens TaxID=294 RepID=A0A0F4SQZ0_PSEFL|nr:membrane protein [Pseudomonas fluorescens]KJZ34180.1 membrane protein [Pseudomonas fluorescens]